MIKEGDGSYKTDITRVQKLVQQLREYSNFQMPELEVVFKRFTSLFRRGNPGFEKGKLRVDRVMDVEHMIKSHFDAKILKNLLLDNRQKLFFKSQHTRHLYTSDVVSKIKPTFNEDLTKL